MSAARRGTGGPASPPAETPAVVLLVGEDREACERALRGLQEALPEHVRDVAVERFDGSELVRALDAARTVPLFGGRRLIVVRNVDWLAGRGGDAAREALASYVAAPATGSTLALIATRADRRLAVVKRIEKAGGLVVCERPREREMAGWVRQRAAERGIDLPAQAAAALADAIGTDTALAARELDKLALLVRDDSGRRRKL